MFGDLGLVFTVILAMVATLSGLIASVYSASRMLAMLSSMKQLPRLYQGISNPALVLTVTLAVTLTILFDLTRIASIGAIFYLLMDIAIHWGLFRFLLKETKANPVIPLLHRNLPDRFWHDSALAMISFSQGGNTFAPTASL